MTCISSTLAIVVISTVPTAQLDQLSAQQFERLAKGVFAKLDNITFIYEGDLRRELPDTKENTVWTRFQGLYSYRNDGSTLLDLFKIPGRGDLPAEREICVSFNSKLTTLVYGLDTKQPQISTSNAIPGCINKPLSPERINFLWFLYGIDNYQNYGYEFLSWENIEGNVCAKIRMNDVSNDLFHEIDSDMRPYKHLWVDIKRGMNPLKVESYRGKDCYMESKNIQLKNLEINDNVDVWVPISGMTDTYVVFSQDPDEGVVASYSRNPASTERYFLVGGSVVVNDSIPDKYFTVMREDVKFDNKEMQKLSTALNSAPQRELPTFSLDPDVVGEKLEEQLMLAEHQSNQLEASSAAKVASRWSIAQRGVFILAGVMLIATGLYWRHRR